MHAMDGLLDGDNAAAAFFQAGNDLLMICSHWTDTERARGFAQALIRARAEGVLDPVMLESSRSRILSILSQTPQHDVKFIEPGEFAAHRLVGPLFGSETVEVV
jgi:beta-N-acetylhexosaminidase